MKKAIVAIALAAVAQVASATIATGSHDLRVKGGTLSACQYCHAPHNVNTGIPGAPLWNRKAPATATWQFYTSNTVSTVPTALGANSATCLSCHDGFTNMGDTFVGSKDLALGALSGYADVGLATGDLRNDHPISIRYIPGTAFNTIAAIQADGLKVYGVAGSETVECGSCHDPHGDSNAATGGASFLRAAAADICTACHNK
jgi:predicted CXXCH cytochrome family protein